MCYGDCIPFARSTIKCFLKFKLFGQPHWKLVTVYIDDLSIKKLVNSSPKTTTLLVLHLYALMTTTLLVLHTRNHDDKVVVICRSLLEVQTLSCQRTMHKEHKSSNYVRGRTATLRNCKYLCNQNHSDTIFSWYCTAMNSIIVSW